MLIRIRRQTKLVIRLPKRKHLRITKRWRTVEDEAEALPEPSPKARRRLYARSKKGPRCSECRVRYKSVRRLVEWPRDWDGRDALPEGPPLCRDCRVEHFVKRIDSAQAELARRAKFLKGKDPHWDGPNPFVGHGKRIVYRLASPRRRLKITLRRKLK